MCVRGFFLSPLSIPPLSCEPIDRLIKYSFSTFSRYPPSYLHNTTSSI